MSLSAHDLDALCRVACAAARKAGAVIQAFSAAHIDVRYKKAGTNLASQVFTEIDLRADAVIRQTLLPTCAPYDLAILTEEIPDDRARLQKHAFWSADPLDGTLAFIDSQPGYAVSVALVTRGGTPLIGAVYDPLKDVLYSATRGQCAQRQGKPWTPLSTQPRGRAFALVCDHGFDRRDSSAQVARGIAALATQQGFEDVHTACAHGAVMNAMRVLERAPGCYFKYPKPQQGGGSLWDFAATAAIFNACGAVACDFFGQPLDLNRADSTFMNHRGVLYVSEPAWVAEISALQPAKQ